MSYFMKTVPRSGPGDESAHGTHTAVSGDLTSRLGQILPPELAGAGVRGLGLANEVAGGLSVLGNPNPHAQAMLGFDVGDMQANEAGIAPAVQTLTDKQRQPPESVQEALVRALQFATGTQGLSTLVGGASNLGEMLAQRLSGK